MDPIIKEIPAELDPNTVSKIHELLKEHNDRMEYLHDEYSKASYNASSNAFGVSIVDYKDYATRLLKLIEIEGQTFPAELNELQALLYRYPNQSLEETR